ncbi:MAG: RDD family protein [Methanothrix sp.]
MPFCTNCGEEFKVGSKFCSRCGTKIATLKLRDELVSPKDKPNKLEDGDHIINYASFGDRFLGSFIDYLIALALFIITLFIIQSSSIVFNLIPPYFYYFTIYYLVSFVVVVGYFIFFEGIKGQTIGKMISHTKVVKENGSKCDLFAASIRNLLRIIDFLPAYYILGALLISRSKKAQRLGDRVAKTIVVKVKQKRNGNGE